MIDAIPYEWLLENDVPLLFFIIALLTRPSTWSKTVVGALKERFSSDG
jgi:hypothetical protein